MRFPVCTALVLAMSAAAFGNDSLQGLLVFDRHAILRGELWRLASGHLVHFSPSHLAVDLLAFGIIGGLLEHRHRTHCALLYPVMGFAIGTALLLLDRELFEFGGLSGLAYGVLTYLALLEMQGPHRRLAALVLAALPLKVGLEFSVARPLTDPAGWHAFIPVPLSHAAGIVAALVMRTAALRFWFRKEKGPTLAGEPLSLALEKAASQESACSASVSAASISCTLTEPSGDSISRCLRRSSW